MPLDLRSLEYMLHAFICRHLHTTLVCSLGYSDQSVRLLDSKGLSIAYHTRSRLLAHQVMRAYIYQNDAIFEKLLNTMPVEVVVEVM
jgi:hypothetical protein